MTRWRILALLFLARIALGFQFQTMVSVAKDSPPVSRSAPRQLTGGEWRLIICAASAWGIFNAGYVVYLTFGPTMLTNLGHTPIDAASVISVGS